LAQWAIFALSAGVFLWTASMVRNETQLRRLTFTFLLLASPLVVLRPLGDVWWSTGHQIATAAIYNAPFWVAVSALVGGQLAFNAHLSRAWRVFLWVILGAIVFYIMQIHAERVSHWVGVVTVAVTLVFLRLRRGRWLFLIACLLAAVALFPSLYEFAGGDAKREESGDSRLLLIGRVIELTARDPILGLGPASYRQYGFAYPLNYGDATWVVPKISSHNNYVDIYAQTGIVGLGLFIWFVAAVGRLGWRLCQTYQSGFAAGYANGMLAALVATLVIMLMLDWFLPFVYDVGFKGFQASALLWMFLGGLVSLDAWHRSPQFR
jgi:O-antigen ligase